MSIRLNVLAIDPDPRPAWMDALEQAGYHAMVHRSEGVDQLLHTLSLGDAQLLLADYDHPTLGGLKVLELVRQADSAIPTIFLGSGTDAEAAATAILEGAAGWVSKDRLDRLGPAVTRALARRALAVPAEARLHRARTALLHVARARSLQGENLIDDLRAITEVAAGALGVARASVWLYDHGRGKIRCIDLFEPAADRHTDGQELYFKDHPAYFLALEEQRVIAAHDARQDPRTADYGPDYLEPLGITSMLDAAVRRGGQLVGVICLEQVGPPRRWTTTEEVFACAFADLVALALEASERQAAEQKLRESEERFREVFQNASDCLILLRSRDGGRRFVCEGINPATEATTGIPAEAAVGRTLHETMPAGQADHLTRLYRDCLASNAPVVYEMDFTGPAGLRWFHSVAVPLRRPDGPAERLAVIARDVTERKRAEEALSEREALYRQLVETTNVIPWEAEADGDRFTFVGPQAERRFGYPVAQWYRPGFWADHLHPEDRAATVAACAAGAARGGEYELEYRFLARDGEAVWVRDFINVVPGTAGRKKLRGFLTDVTPHKKAEDAFRQLNHELEQRVAERTAQLEATNRELEAFCYSVSHDLRAPLRAIDGFSQALLEDCGERLGADGQDHLHRVRAAAQRMSELIDDLLALSRVTRSALRPTTVNLSKMAEAILAGLRLAHPERQVTATVAPDLFAQGDANLLRVALENLLGNAWKYTAGRDHAQVRFGSVAHDGATVYYVEDNGAGFDPAYADKLFKPFQRLHRPDEFEGHGIGLATVQRILFRHGGRAWAEGAAGRGATFYFTLGTVSATGSGQRWTPVPSSS